MGKKTSRKSLLLTFDPCKVKCDEDANVEIKKAPKRTPQKTQTPKRVKRLPSL